MDPIDDFVQTAVADICNVERSDIVPTTILADIGFDSLTAIAFVSLAESTYDVEFGDNAMVQLYAAKTPLDLVALVSDARAATGHVAVDSSDG
jgi:acyl carrier protein